MPSMTACIVTLKLLHCMVAVGFIGENLDLTTLTSVKYSEQGREKRVYIIDDMSARWRKVGWKLKFTTPDIDMIASSCQDDTECCDKLLSQWLQGHKNRNGDHPNKVCSTAWQDVHSQDRTTSSTVRRRDGLAWCSCTCNVPTSSCHLYCLWKSLMKVLFW